MRVLADTNVLIRRTQPDHPLHSVAVESIARLIAAGDDVGVTPQNIAEFWNVLTRPLANNGLGFDVALARREVDLLERLRTILPDSPLVYDEWKRLVVTHRVMGVKVHDARLVASMNVHRVRAILTFNTDDFARYTTDAAYPITVIQPSSVP
ncbi:MAG: type II toxin-antitoxin system VapC family toxin [Chloroflexota bacterium]